MWQISEVTSITLDFEKPFLNIPLSAIFINLHTGHILKKETVKTCSK